MDKPTTRTANRQLNYLVYQRGDIQACLHWWQFVCRSTLCWTSGAVRSLKRAQQIFRGEETRCVRREARNLSSEAFPGEVACRCSGLRCLLLCCEPWGSGTNWPNPAPVWEQASGEQAMLTLWFTKTLITRQVAMNADLEWDLNILSADGSLLCLKRTVLIRQLFGFAAWTILKKKSRFCYRSSSLEEMNM